ncbi:Disintegrin and metalloproteinase domain-containing protein 9, partial [Armadillidium vulgare]
RKKGSSGLCGNGRLDPTEHCDCGSVEKCIEVDPCCDPKTCQLKMDADCATGPCCENCRLKSKNEIYKKSLKVNFFNVLRISDPVCMCSHSQLLKPKGTLCRGIQTECDIPEFCDGTHGHCPIDIHMKNGNICGIDSKSYCFNGVCPTRDEQCKIIWGYVIFCSKFRCRFLI